jgi:tyrosine-protein phosphatase YwqE
MGIFGNIFHSDKLKHPVDLSSVAADMHSHLIPGIDDGSKTMEESIELIRSLHTLGYKKLVTTPHIISDYFKNTPEIITSGLEKLREAITVAGLPVTIEAAAEYMLDAGFIKKYKSEKLLTFGNNYLLIELSAYTPPENLFQIFFDLKIDGYNPILAHPERYHYWHYNIDHYISLKDREIFFQINLPSLAGYYSPEVRKIAEQLIDNNLVDFVGTDMHNTVYFDQVEKSRFSKHLEKLINSGKLLNNTL